MTPEQGNETPQSIKDEFDQLQNRMGRLIAEATDIKGRLSILGNRFGLEETPIHLRPIPGISQYPDLAYDFSGGEFTAAGTLLCRLTKTQSRFLERLLWANGGVVTHRELAEACYPKDQANEGDVSNERIYSLKGRVQKQLNGVSPELAKHIETVMGHGVRWSPPKS